MESLTIREIISAVGGICLNKPLVGNISIISVSIDSRKVEQDSLYIPIKGDQFDGHDFIADAFHNGCTIAQIGRAHV